ncbi:hypothetical protein Pmani_009624 [Petrolisthes manimaculis]|uniref:Uncharacterized protein n=1 Tax=Petrolisthes manimaculis TaxID=1843537 RepID=A0AAE1Q4K2_9EUCA|nr:hypothetical protein Pmani_009624 [Petrolisthes manimaculis]
MVGSDSLLGVGEWLWEWVEWLWEWVEWLWEWVEWWRVGKVVGSGYGGELKGGEWVKRCRVAMGVGRVVMGVGRVVGSGSSGEEWWGVVMGVCQRVGNGSSGGEWLCEWLWECVGVYGSVVGDKL